MTRNSTPDRARRQSQPTSRSRSTGCRRHALSPSAAGAACCRRWRQCEEAGADRERISARARLAAAGVCRDRRTLSTGEPARGFDRDLATGLLRQVSRGSRRRTRRTGRGCGAQCGAGGLRSPTWPVSTSTCADCSCAAVMHRARGAAAIFYDRHAALRAWRSRTNWMSPRRTRARRPARAGGADRCRGRGRALHPGDAPRPVSGGARRRTEPRRRAAHRPAEVAPGLLFDLLRRPDIAGG